MKIINKKASYNYHLYDRYEAGIVLTGSEVKAIKNGKVDISRSYVKEIGNELYLVNAVVSTQMHVETNSRKLLLHKNELFTIFTKTKAKKLTLVPTKIYTKGHLIKLEFALGRAKRKYEKRHKEKIREIKREIEREYKD